MGSKGTTALAPHPGLLLAFDVSAPGSEVTVPTTITLIRVEYQSAHFCVYDRDDEDRSRPAEGESKIPLADELPARPETLPFSIVHTRGTPLRLRATFRVDAANQQAINVGDLHCIVRAVRNKTFKFGEPVPPDDQGLTSLSSGEVDVRGRTFTVELQADSPMVSRLRWLRGVEFIWTVELHVFTDGLPPIRLNFDAGKSRTDIFLTFGKPVEDGFYRRHEDRVTTARLHKAYALFELLDKEPSGSPKKMNDTDAHSLCRCLLNTFGKIVLKPNPALKHLNHPGYFEAQAGVRGGAWHLMGHFANNERGECQAMVRLMRALVYLTGGVADPKNAAVTVTYARPDDSRAADKAVLDNENEPRFVSPLVVADIKQSRDVIDSGGLHAFQRIRNIGGKDETQTPVLLSVVAGVGAKLVQSNGLNFYEAALRLEAAGRIAFYAGGIFTPFTEIEGILRIHVGLVWVADTDDDPVTHEGRKIVREFVQGYIGNHVS
jgi:hypothetical protein